MKTYSIAVPLGVLVLVVVLDQFTKWLILQSFSMYESREIIPGFFNLTFLTNTGAAFGMFAGAKNSARQFFFIGIAVAALTMMAFAFRHFRDKGGLYVYAIGLIGGGAAGNLIDRLRFGAVVDFLDFYIKSYHWPAFNVADSAITVGVGLFLLAGLLEKPEEKKQER